VGNPTSNDEWPGKARRVLEGGGEGRRKGFEGNMKSIGEGGSARGTVIAS
jgi:hypothetical protein